MLTLSIVFRVLDNGAVLTRGAIDVVPEVLRWHQDNCGTNMRHRSINGLNWWNQNHEWRRLTEGEQHQAQGSDFEHDAHERLSIPAGKRDWIRTKSAMVHSALRTATNWCDALDTWAHDYYLINRRAFYLPSQPPAFLLYPPYWSVFRSVPYLVA